MTLSSSANILTVKKSKQNSCALNKLLRYAMSYTACQAPG